jgi:uncharacterized SAM-binding protein YcdF (DUF218 family)
VTVTPAGNRHDSAPRAGGAAVVILGKHQGTRSHNLELRGRVALGAAVWHSLRDDSAPVYFLAADTHGPARVPDAVLVRRLLAERYHLPPSVVHVRRWSRCTVAEVRGMRALARRRRFDRILVVTHGYHAPRAASYFSEVRLTAEILPVQPETLARLPLARADEALRARIAEAIGAARIGSLHDVRERVTETLVTTLHRFDRRGRVERWLARRLRS